MTMRVTGLISGMDTESMITELTKANSKKVETLKGDQKKLEWTKDAWKDLNKEIVTFYKGALSDMRFDSAFNKKTTNVSDSSFANVITSDNAMLASQKLKVKQLASSAYATSDKIAGLNDIASGERAGTSLSTLGIDPGEKFRMTFGEDSEDFIEIDIEEGETIQSFVNKLRGAESSKTGQKVNVNFDADAQRLFIASTDTGKDASFQIDATNSSSAILTNLGLEEGKMAYEAGQDSIINLNGVDYESKNNTHSINGLTITAKKETKGDEFVTLTTETDTSGIYDKIKSFLKKYNELVKKFDELYNAPNAKDYTMLTEEEEWSMSEKQVEDWNNKIKESLLRKDATLGKVSSAMKTIMASAFEVEAADGSTKKMSIAAFGIKTLSYFEAEDNERGVYHIDGDADDENSANNEDKLRAAIAKNPEEVSGFFKKLASSMYEKLTGLMARTEFSSTYTVYEDKKMETQYNSYKTKIANETKKLQDIEDKYYKQFAAMEKALAKTQSQQSQLAGYLG